MRLTKLPGRITGQRRPLHMLNLLLGGAVSLGLLLYLVWALVRPEDF